MLYIKGNMKPRFNSEDQFEFKVNNMMLLSDVRDKMLNNVQINLKADQVQQGFLQEFYQLLDHSKGMRWLSYT